MEWYLHKINLNLIVMGRPPFYRTWNELDTVFHRTKSCGDQKIHMHLVVAYWVITKWLRFSKSVEGNKFLENNFYFIDGAFRYLRIFSCFMETIPFWMLAEKLCFREYFDTIFLTISKMTMFRCKKFISFSVGRLTDFHWGYIELFHY